MSSRLRMTTSPSPTAPTASSGLPGRADLSHDGDVERCVQGAGNLCGNDDAAARQPDHDRVSFAVREQMLRERRSRVGAVSEGSVAWTRDLGHGPAYPAPRLRRPPYPGWTGTVPVTRVP